MKVIIKKTTVVICCFLLLVIMNRSVFAIDGSSVTDRKTGDRSLSCDKIAAFDTRVNQIIEEKKKRIQDKRTDSNQKSEARREGRDQKIEQKRDELNKKREEHYAKLRERAQTDEQKAAVEDFINQVEEAINVRKAAIDKAIAEYRVGVDEAVSGRKNEIANATSNFKSAVVAASTKAKADCDAGVDPKTVRENMKTSLENAREKFKQDLKHIEKLREEIKVLGEVRKQSIGAAISEFKESLESSREHLKAAVEG